MMLRSLKVTLMFWVILLMLLIVPSRAYLELRGQAERSEAAYDVSLSDWALALGNLVKEEGGRVSFRLNAQTEESLRTSSTEDHTFYVVLGPHGETIAGDASLAMAQPPLKIGKRRLSDVQVGDQRLRMVSHAVECGSALCQVRVAETQRTRNRTRDESLVVTATLSLAAGALLALAIGLVVTRTMRPLIDVNQQLAQRSLDDLRPLRRERMPTELQPLMDAVDQLMNRLAADAELQRHFIADAAHQIRTPLTALRTETELALLEPHPPALHAMLKRMHVSTQRVARLAEQLLALARAEASNREPGGSESVNLKAIAVDAAQDWVPRALERGADLGFQLAPAPVRGRRHLLGELLANLIHNALEYASTDPSRPARITVRTWLTEPGAAVVAGEGRDPGEDDGSAATVMGGGNANREAVLEVEDNGPGIAASERGRVLERFYRPAGSAGSGSGLGLAIVRDIAQAHGARLALLDGEDGRGLRVRVSFPAA